MQKSHPNGVHILINRLLCWGYPREISRLRTEANEFLRWDCDFPFFQERGGYMWAVSAAAQMMATTDSTGLNLKTDRINVLSLPFADYTSLRSRPHHAGDISFRIEWCFFCNQQRRTNIMCPNVPRPPVSNLMRILLAAKWALHWHILLDFERNTLCNYQTNRLPFLLFQKVSWISYRPFQWDDGFTVSVVCHHC